MSRIVIHRDHTFTYAGRQYRILNHGPGWGYEIEDLETGRSEDGWFTFADIRDGFEGFEEATE